VSAAHPATEITRRHVLMPIPRLVAAKDAPILSLHPDGYKDPRAGRRMSAHSRTRLALVLTLALPATAAAQAPVAATTLDQVIVTGTRASDRTVLESTSPVDVL